MKHEAHHETAEEKQSLWLLVIAPSIWAVHFLASYIAAAIWCRTELPAERNIDALRSGILLAGVVCLAGVWFIGRTGWRKYRIEGGSPPFDKDTPEDRHRFLGAATVMLAFLSAIAVVYSCLSLLFVKNCL